MKNAHNEKLEREGRKRRARLLRQSIAGKTDKQLSELHGVSRQRIQWMLNKAKKEI